MNSTQSSQQVTEAPNIQEGNEETRPTLKVETIQEETGTVQEETGSDHEETGSTQGDTDSTQDETESPHSPSSPIASSTSPPSVSKTIPSFLPIPRIGALARALSSPDMPTSESLNQSLYLRPNVNFCLNEIEQPKEITIHVVTTSDSQEIHLEEIRSMIITLSIMNNALEDVPTAVSDYLTKLFATRLESLKYLELSEFRMSSLLWTLLSNLRLDWLYLKRPLLDFYFFRPNSSPGFERLNLKLKEDQDLCMLPLFPSSLKELYLHFSNIKRRDASLVLSHYESLEKM